MRLDVYLVEKGYYRSRVQAQEAIDKGFVLLNGKKALKASYDYNDEIIEAFPLMEYVSRGGLKLEKAINDFHLDFSSKIIVDIGSSTGGFTDCALKHGAAYVYSVDIGTNQLDLSLRNNPLVCSLEETDFLDIPFFPKPIDYYITDVSFISLGMIIPHIKALDGQEMVVLIKPQFEVEYRFLNKNGVLKDRSMHLKVLESINEVIENNGYHLHKLTPSPIKGKNGNIEYLAYIKKDSKAQIDFYEVVKKAFEG